MTKILILSFISFVSYALSQNECYVSMNDAHLYKFNPNTCETFDLGLVWGGMFDIAVTPSGRVYGTDSENLFEINTTNGSTTFINHIFDTGQGINNLIGLNDDYLMAVSGWDLYKINCETGDKVLIGSNSLLGGSSGDITRFKGDFYLAKVNNNLIRFSLNIDYSEIISVALVGIMNTEYDDVYGVLTIGEANCFNDNLKLLAFEGNTVYDVNPNTAYCTLLCDSISEFGITGAASIMEISLQNFESEIFLPNVFSPNNDGINDFYEPIKLKGIAEIEIEILNRWGNIVYKSSDIDFIWDGNDLRNDKCNDGVYFYKIVLTNFCGYEVMKNGFISLIN
jgi:gliding motility-associated-like protein